MSWHNKPVDGTKITGASDDLIVIEGEITEEFAIYDSEGFMLACSDGTVLSVKYDHDALWRFSRLVAGTLDVHIEQGDVEADRHDAVHFPPGLRWIALASQLVRKK